MAFGQRELRAFLAVVDEGSLGRAAEAIHLSQPALSRLIQQLERRFAQPLFERQPRGMVLTPAGEALAPHARLLLFEMEHAVDALDALRGVRRGVLRVGAVAAVARSLLPDVVGRLLQASPGIRVEVMEAPDDRLSAALAGREIDLMIATEQPLNDDIGLVGECGFSDVYAVFCASDHPLASCEAVTLEQVLAQSWIMPAPNSTPRALFETIVRNAGRPMPVVAVQTGSVGVMLAFAARTRLLGWLPEPLLAGEDGRGAIRRLSVEALAIGRRFFVYRRRRGLLPAPAVEFLRLLPLPQRPG